MRSWWGGKGRTVGLDSDIHLGFRGMRDGVGAELDIGAIMNVSDGLGEGGLVTRETPAIVYMSERHSLLHNDISQGVAESVALVEELKGCGRGG